MCFGDSGQTVFTITFPSNLSSSFVATKVWSIGNSDAHTCFVDWGRGVVWVFGRNNGVLFRVNLNKNPATGLTTFISSPFGYNIRGRASAINNLTDTAYIACDNAKLLGMSFFFIILILLVVPLNTTNLLTPLTVLNVGVSDLLSLAIDESQNYIFIGTDIGIGLKYTIGTFYI